MDIRDIPSRTTGPADESRAARGVAPSATPRAAADRSPDSVTLSDRAQAFQETRRAALAVPDVRSERVDQVRAKLAGGSLVPDPERIARALLEQGVVSF
jgi:flagellar biosynthesis anti-sigma factor FlgM